MRRAVTLITVLGAALGLSACGEKHDTLKVPAGDSQSLTMMLDAPASAEHVGLYQSLADGAFAAAGVNVHIETPSTPSEPLELLAAGKVDVAIASEPQVLLARNQGLPLVGVGAIAQKPLAAIVSVGKSRIATPAQLRGKTIGTGGLAFGSDILAAILQRAGVAHSSAHEVNVGFRLTEALSGGSVDATVNPYAPLQAIQLAQKHPNAIGTNAGAIPTYDEFVVVVRKATIVNQANLIRRFVQTLARGYQAARSNPAAATTNLLGANPGLNSRVQLAAVKASLPAFFPGNHRVWGWQNQIAWSRFSQWMTNHHLLTNPQAGQAASTNELLAGQGI